MKRPFCVIGFTGFAVLLFMFLTDSNAVAYCVFFACASIGTMTLFKKSLRQALTVPVCLFAVATACLLFFNFNMHKQSVQGLIGDNIAVEAVVYEAPYMKNENGRHYCVLELNTVDGKKAKGRLRLSFSPQKDDIDEKELQPGNLISFTGKVYIPGEAEKSISRYFTGESILLGAYSARNVSITRTTAIKPGYYFQLLRSFVSERLRYCFGDKVAGMLIGILTGDKSVLYPGLYDSLRKTGTAHLMAVSGLHLSLWVFALGTLIPQKRKTEKLRTLLLMSAVIFIMLLSGMSESVKRAGFMSLVFLSGKLIKKDCDSLNSLGFAVTLMLIYNPACVLSLSLQLSFLSTLGILTLGKKCIEESETLFGGKRINTPLRKLLRYFSDMYFLNLSVLIFTFPVLVFSFGGISTVSAWVNILLSPFVSPLLISAGICVLLSSVSCLFYPVSLFVKFMTSYIIAVTELFSQAENAFLTAQSNNAPLFLAAAIIIALSIIIPLKSFTRKAEALVCSLLIASILIISAK